MVAAVPDEVVPNAWNGSAWIVTGKQRARTYANSTTQLTFLVNNDTAAVNWLVQVNGVDEGTIADHDLAAIELAAFRDHHANLGQLAELLRSAAHRAGTVIKAGPAGVFWAVLLLALCDSRDVILALHGVTAADLVVAARIFLALLGITMVCSVILDLSAGCSLVENRFKAATLDLIRRKQGLGEDARITLSRCSDAASEGTS